MNNHGKLIDEYFFNAMAVLLEGEREEDEKVNARSSFAKTFLTGEALEKFAAEYDVRMWVERYAKKTDKEKNKGIFMYRLICTYDFLYSLGYERFEMSFLHYLMTGEKDKRKWAYPKMYDEVNTLTYRCAADICGYPLSVLWPYALFPSNHVVMSESFSMGFESGEELVFVRMLDRPDIQTSLDTFLRMKGGD